MAFEEGRALYRLGRPRPAGGSIRNGWDYERAESDPQAEAARKAEHARLRARGVTEETIREMGL